MIADFLTLGWKYLMCIMAYVIWQGYAEIKNASAIEGYGLVFSTRSSIV
ncbi:hypothetical protein [Candidatus Nitrosotenuis sp. DW1]|nr:hypothetical protein [Candidatus Nitrosotenuis sp. DW1]